MKLIFLVFFSVVLLSSASGQIIKPEKVKKLRVSEELRARLVERLNLYIEYELTQQYDKQFDLLATKCPEYLNCSISEKQAYVEAHRKLIESYGTLIGFKLTGRFDRKLKDNCIFIPLMPKFRKDKYEYTNAFSFHACLQDNYWFFNFALIDI